MSQNNDNDVVTENVILPQTGENATTSDDSAIYSNDKLSGTSYTRSEGTTIISVTPIYLQKMYHVKVSTIESILNYFQTEQLVPQQQRSCGMMEKQLIQNVITVQAINNGKQIIQSLL
jgi:hypothetical protein